MEVKNIHALIHMELKQYIFYLFIFVAAYVFSFLLVGGYTFNYVKLVAQTFAKQGNTVQVPYSGMS